MDDKATEALESLRQKFTSGNDVAVERAMITRAEYEALASAQPEGPELTDAEIEERWWGELDNRSLSSIRAVIAAHEAKRNGGAA